MKTDACDNKSNSTPAVIFFREPPNIYHDIISYPLHCGSPSILWREDGTMTVTAMLLAEAINVSKSSRCSAVKI